jgi:hypothetical protein
MQSISTRWLLVGLAASLCCAPAFAAKAPGVRKPPRHFQRLFNEKNFTHWQGLIELPQRNKLSPEARSAQQAKADELMRAHWQVVDGVLEYDGKGNSLQTARDYGNFEMYVDWRIEKGGDSGIYLRGNPQVQIWEESDAPALENGRFIGSGGLYNNQNHPSKPLAVADRPAGEWNTFFIRMIGDRVTVKLNDRLVVDDTPLENYWERGKPLPARGPIELQHHGSHLEFRNIFIRELPDDEAAARRKAGH